MKCIIVEDQAPAQRILKKYISDYPALELVGTFSDALSAIAFLRGQEVELIFLDIHLPQISGMEFLKMLPRAPHVILTTAFPDYALESYEFAVVDYLLKPFSFQRFVQAVSKIPAPVKSSSSAAAPPKEPTDPGILFVKSGHTYFRLKLAEVIFIQSADDYTEIFTADQNKILASESLQHWESTLPEHLFRRIHKSYLIHTERIEKIANNHVFLEQGHKVPIGRSYKEEFLQFITQQE